MTARHRITVLQTHPVQYMAPWFRYIASERREIDLTVLYASMPMPAQQGVGFNESFAWDVGLTEGGQAEPSRPHATATSIPSRRSRPRAGRRS